MRRVRQNGAWPVYAVFALLVALQFYARPRLWDGRGAPDFLLLALLVFAMRSRPGVAAVAGFVVGLVTDILTPARFGAGALAHTAVAYLGSWGRAVFFADNLLVNAGFFVGGVFARNLVVLVASGTSGPDLLVSLTLWSPLQALSTMLAGVLVVLLFRDWLAIRFDQ